MAADVISFARGAPSTDILPADSVREAAAGALESDWERALSYGLGPGHPGLCEWIAELHEVKPEQVMTTNGSLEAGAMVFDHFLEPGDRVAVEQPSYDRTLLLLGKLGVELVPIPLEDDGLDVGALEAAVAAGPIKLAHVIPNFHNPAGCTLSIDKRRAIVELAAKHDFAVFEDDPYRLIDFEKKPWETMLSLDRAERVIHASSFSKTVAPGIRVGYLAGPADRIAALAKRANELYISPNMLAGSLVYELARSGALEKNIKVVNAALADRRNALVESLRERIPEADFVAPGGGYFLWLTLGDDVDAGELVKAGKEEGVAILPGTDFMIEGGRSSVRLSFAPVPAERIDEGVARLARALERTRAASPA